MGGEDMAEAGRRALVDLSEVDLATVNLTKGSVLDHALERARRERDRGGSQYASFINSPNPSRPERDEDE